MRIRENTDPKVFKKFMVSLKKSLAQMKDYNINIPIIFSIHADWKDGKLTDLKYLLFHDSRSHTTNYEVLHLLDLHYNDLFSVYDIQKNPKTNNCSIFKSNSKNIISPTVYISNSGPILWTHLFSNRKFIFPVFLYNNFDFIDDIEFDPISSDFSFIYKVETDEMTNRIMLMDSKKEVLDVLGLDIHRSSIALYFESYFESDSDEAFAKDVNDLRFDSLREFIKENKNVGEVIYEYKGQKLYMYPYEIFKGNVKHISLFDIININDRILQIVLCYLTGEDIYTYTSYYMLKG